ncbi:MAG: L-aspartate oxidase [Planctomycetota bacterium]
MVSIDEISSEIPTHFSLPRYLTSFHPKRLPHWFTDVLIIGGGVAGLRAANAIPPSLSALVVSKDELELSNSSWAQGGIAGVMDPEDRFENHIADTLTAGGSLCDESVVEMVVREAPDRIRELIQWGTHFDETAGGLILGREGGHSHHRIVHALGDATGREMMRALIAHTKLQSHLHLWPRCFTLDLITADGVCRGALVADQRRGPVQVWAKQTILATGGIGQVYRESTNPAVATGDGHAIALRAGVALRDMEFLQFHPTVLYIAGSGRSLITEAIRGEGARLIDRRGYRFMPDYDAREELAPRDIVSQSIETQMQKTHHACVYLDLSHLDADFVRRRFPGIAQTCAKFGLDITKDRIPVRPGAHYMIGGAVVDSHGRTSLPGLWAAGEVTSTGLHGANRLASNSLLEGLVFGAHAGEGAAAAAASMADSFHPGSLSYEAPVVPTEPLDLADIRNSLKSLMWRAAGVQRTQADLREALETIDAWCRYVLVQPFANSEGWELQNMLTVARPMIQAALLRKESRGVHLRVDFPDTDELRWRRHLSFQRQEDSQVAVRVEG